MPIDLLQKIHNIKKHEEAFPTPTPKISNENGEHNHTYTHTHTHTLKISFCTSLPNSKMKPTTNIIPPMTSLADKLGLTSVELSSVSGRLTDHTQIICKAGQGGGGRWHTKPSKVRAKKQQRGQGGSGEGQGSSRNETERSSEVVATFRREQKSEKKIKQA